MNEHYEEIHKTESFENKVTLKEKIYIEFDTTEPPNLVPGIDSKSTTDSPIPNSKNAEHHPRKPSLKICLDLVKDEFEDFNTVNSKLEGLFTPLSITSEEMIMNEDIDFFLATNSANRTSDVSSSFKYSTTEHSSSLFGDSLATFITVRSVPVTPGIEIDTLRSAKTMNDRNFEEEQELLYDKKSELSDLSQDCEN